MLNMLPTILGAIGRDGEGARAGIDLGPFEAADFLATTAGEHQQLNNAPIIVFRRGEPNLGHLGIGERSLTRATLVLRVGAVDGIVITKPLPDCPLKHCGKTCARPVGGNAAAIFCECRKLGGYVSAANAGKRKTVERFPVAL